MLRITKGQGFLTLMLALFLLNSCGFHALYKDGGNNQSALPVLASITVDTIPEREGQLLQGYLEDLLNPTKVNVPRIYRLETKLHKEKVPLVIEINRRITRYNLIFTSDYSLRDMTTGTTIHSNASRMVGSFDAADSEFSVYTAEEDTANRILKEMANDMQLKITAYFLSQKSINPSMVRNENTSSAHR